MKENLKAFYKFSVVYYIMLQ